MPTAIHEIHRIAWFDLAAGDSVRVRCAGGTEQHIDLEPILESEFYGPLRDSRLFRAVRIDPAAHTLVWPNGAGFGLATLRDWPSHAEAFADRTRTWRSMTSD